MSKQARGAACANRWWQSVMTKGRAEVWWYPGKCLIVYSPLPNSLIAECDKYRYTQNNQPMQSDPCHVQKDNVTKIILSENKEKKNCSSLVPRHGTI